MVLMAFIIGVAIGGVIGVLGGILIMDNEYDRKKRRG